MGRRRPGACRSSPFRAGCCYLQRDLDKPGCPDLADLTFFRSHPERGFNFTVRSLSSHFTEIPIPFSLRGRFQPVKRIVHFRRRPQPMQQHCELARHSDHRTLLAVLSATCCEFQTPPSQSAVRRQWAEDVMSSLDQQTPQISIPRF
jgi:hypothetical protein